MTPGQQIVRLRVGDVASSLSLTCRLDVLFSFSLIVGVYIVVVNVHEMSVTAREDWIPSPFTEGIPRNQNHWHRSHR